MLPRQVRARLSIEAGVSLGWERWVGDEGAILALDGFGLSAPAEQIFERFGFSPENVVRVARGVLAGEVRGVVSEAGEHLGAQFRETEIAVDMAEADKAARVHLVEKLAETDDAIMATYLDGAQVDEAVMRAAIRAATVQGKIFPVVCGTAFKNKGIQSLLDAVVDYLPSPEDVPRRRARCRARGTTSRGRRRTTSRSRHWPSRS